MKRREILQALGVSALATALPRAGRADSPLRIGVLADLSGPLADISGPGVVSAVRMAVQDFGGTVAGRPIEVVVADMQSGVDFGVGVARQWFDRDGVDVIVDVPNSAVALGIQQLAREKKRICLFTGAGTTELSGKSCSPYGFQWAFDTYTLAACSTDALISQGDKTWFFVTVDYAFGTSLAANAAALVKEHGGTVVGEIRYPPDTTDFSAFLLQAMSSGAQVVGLATTTAGAANCIKQAHEFGMDRKKQKLAALVLYLADVHALGLDVAQGTTLTESYYWNLTEPMRAYGKRYFAINQAMPGQTQAAPYCAVTHYLKSVQKVGRTDADAVSDAMRALPVNDFMTKDGVVRIDGRVPRDMYLFRVKAPSESKEPWDFLDLVKTVPAAEATRPLDKGGCPLVTLKG
jgi:branched-chain amino acid transport system substrate-binding protein